MGARSIGRKTLMLRDALRPVPGSDALPLFDRGWRLGGGCVEPYISYLGVPSPEGWSKELEAMHADATTDHFIDVWTREAVLAALRAGGLPAQPAVLDLGCSSGLMSADVAHEWPRADILGLDAEAEGLGIAHAALPEVPFIHASATDIPLADAAVDAVVAINVLEHIPDDVAALREVHRVLRPGGRAVIVIPYNPALYDYFDAHLHHERRYASGEMAVKGEQVGLVPVTYACLGSVLYPAFWATKKMHRRRHPNPSPAQRQAMVERDIQATRHAFLGGMAHALERRILALGLRPKFGIRELTVFDRPQG